MSKYVALGEDGARCYINKGGGDDNDDDDDVGDDGDRLKQWFSSLATYSNHLRHFTSTKGWISPRQLWFHWFGMELRE